MSLHKIFSGLGINDYLSFIGVLLIIYVTHYYYKYFTRVNPLPGPLPFPFVGNLPQFILYKANAREFFDAYQKKYGDLYEVHLGARRIILSRAEDIDKLLMPSTKSHYMTRLPYMQGLEEIGMMGKGLILNHNLKSWRFNRQFFTQAILSPKFSQEAIVMTNKLFLEMEDYWDRLYLKEEVIKKNKNVLDFASWLSRFTNDVIVALTTGERSYTMAGYFNDQGEEKTDHPPAIVEDSERFVQSFRSHINNIVMFIFVNPFIRHYIPFFKGRSDESLRNVKFLYDKVDSIIKRRREEIENTPLDKPLPHDMLTSVITANTPRDINYTKTVGGESMDRPMTDLEIRHIMFDAFIGGTDTTANMISFIVYYLAHYPDVKRKVVEEIDRVFQDDKTRPITEKDLHQFKYIDAVIKEVDRVFPVSNMLQRYGAEPDEIAGYKWPRGTMFQVNAVSIHKNKNYWEDPETFNPDRWMVEGFEPKKYSFIMFGGGLRVCPGRKLAMIELVALTALIYRKYDFDLVDMEAPLQVRSGIISACTQLLVKVKSRN
ncbi:cytochrome P450 [Rhizophagus irregularis DAOM 181602=DAOM 197198]|uniref:C-22 sterol desaturase n=4 Tax=Rhizophagus irregularis TaxID=588596 RepID=A0A015KKX0_RHIIW|nr:C-22 sterol desaturase [Rhizophagus irregularis DAOM 197198w]GBC37167.1 cytochrome P450 [Rhizophagus irregularis DAOM 181602=DAOM 197198]